MKKLVVIFLACAAILYSVTLAFALEQGTPGDILSDLPLITKYESSSELKYIREYSKEVQTIILERKQNLDKLYSIIYTGSYTGLFDAVNLNKSINWSQEIKMDSPLFHSELYSKYYKTRTEKRLKSYKDSGVLDYGAFYKAGRAEFDGFVKTVLKNSLEKDQLMILLQEKLTDRLVETEAGKKRTLGDELISLRQPASSSKSLDILYQFFESRIRLELLRDIAEVDKQELVKLTESVSITVSGSTKGSLGIYSKTPDGKLETHKLLSESNEHEGFKGILYLKQFTHDGFTLGFLQDGKPEVLINTAAALEAIQTDHNGYLVLDLDKLLNEVQPASTDKTATSQPAASQAATLKSLGALYTAKSKEASAIVKELNRYSIYLELKNQKISNYYTRSFEKDQKVWKKNLDTKLNAFGKDGMADFWVYIKRFALLDREESKSESSRLLISRFRNSDIQFKRTEAGMLWITDMLYRFKTIK